MSLPPVIYWFRQDLRLEDNHLLTSALATGHPLLPVYILEEHTIRPWGEASRWWLHHSLTALNKSLSGHLCLLRGNPAEELIALSEKMGAKNIFWSCRHEQKGKESDSRLKEQLKTRGTLCQEAPTNLLHGPGTVLNQAGKPFQVFTPYWQQWKKQLLRTAPLPPPKHFTFSSSKGDSLESWNLCPHSPNWAQGFETHWTPGESGAQRRLETFIDKELRGYRERRNRPDQKGTSLLSPHLHWGEISPQQILHALEHACALDPTLTSDGEVFLSELAWREFAHDCLERFPRLTSHPMRELFTHFPWEEQPEHLQAWQQGLTGYPIVDAGMRQLWHTGWMHNRVRMITASFLTKHLMIPWQRGEEWFWNTLVDADEANNGMGWQWVAGCGVDASPYFRIFNPVLQGEKFDPEGNYVRQWVPELSHLPTHYIHQPWNAPPLLLHTSGVKLGDTYPAPLVDHGTCRIRALNAYKELRKAQTLSGHVF